MPGRVLFVCTRRWGRALLAASLLQALATVLWEAPHNPARAPPADQASAHATAQVVHVEC